MVVMTVVMMWAMVVVMVAVVAEVMVGMTVWRWCGGGDGGDDSDDEHTPDERMRDPPGPGAVARPDDPTAPPSLPAGESHSSLRLVIGLSLGVPHKKYSLGYP